MKSVFDQTLKSDEIVLVIDGDITAKMQNLVEEYKSRFNEIRTVKLEKNVGLGMALKVGLDQCSNDIVIRMDTDDICKPYRFERLIEMFQKRPELDVIGSWAEEFYEKEGDYGKVRKVEENNLSILKKVKFRNPMNHPSVAFRKSSVLAVGNYQSFPLLEDYFLWYRMLKSGYLFYNIQESLIYQRIGNDMVGRRHGFKYFLSEYNFFKGMYKSNFINFTELVKNICIRFPLRLAPKFILVLFYSNFLRS